MTSNLFFQCSQPYQGPVDVTLFQKEITENASEAEVYFRLVEYPARKQDLLDKARILGAPVNFLERVNSLPKDLFFSFKEIENAMG